MLYRMKFYGNILCKLFYFEIFKVSFALFFSLLLLLLLLFVSRVEIRWLGSFAVCYACVATATKLIALYDTRSDLMTLLYAQLHHGVIPFRFLDITLSLFDLISFGYSLSRCRPHLSEFYIIPGYMFFFLRLLLGWKGSKLACRIFKYGIGHIKFVWFPLPKPVLVEMYAFRFGSFHIKSTEKLKRITLPCLGRLFSLLLQT